MQPADASRIQHHLAACRVAPKANRLAERNADALSDERARAARQRKRRSLHPRRPLGASPLSRVHGLFYARAKNDQQLRPRDHRDKQHQWVCFRAKHPNRHEQKFKALRQDCRTVVERVKTHANRRREQKAPIKEVPCPQLFAVCRQPQRADHRRGVQDVTGKNLRKISKKNGVKAPSTERVLRVFGKSESGGNRRADDQTVQPVQAAPVNQQDEQHTGNQLSGFLGDRRNRIRKLSSLRDRFPQVEEEHADHQTHLPAKQQKPRERKDGNVPLHVHFPDEQKHAHRNDHAADHIADHRKRLVPRHDIR